MIFLRHDLCKTYPLPTVARTTHIANMDSDLNVSIHFSVLAGTFCRKTLVLADRGGGGCRFHGDNHVICFQEYRPKIIPTIPT